MSIYDIDSSLQRERQKHVEFTAPNNNIDQDPPISRDNFQSTFDTQFIFVAFILQVSSSIQYLNLSTESSVY